MLNWRAELTDAQRAKAHARRAELMEGMGLVSKSGRGGDRRSMAESAVDPYTKQAASSLGVSERTIRQDLRRGREIEPDVLADVAGTSLDKGVVLDQLAATPKPEQRAKLAEITLQRAEMQDGRESG